MNENSKEILRTALIEGSLTILQDYLYEDNENVLQITFEVKIFFFIFILSFKNLISCLISFFFFFFLCYYYYSKENCSPLHVACWFNQQEIIEELIEWNHPLEVTDNVIYFTFNQNKILKI